MDACDAVMTKIKKPKGLIRYTSLTAVREGRFKWLSPRVLGYAGVWVVVTSLFLFFFLTRPLTEVLILRQPGSLAQKQANGDMLNFYLLQVVNKQPHDVPIELKVLSPNNGNVTMIGEFASVPGIAEKTGRFFLTIPKEETAQGDLNVKFGVYSQGKLLKEVDTKFLTTTLN
jgi:polyferredoxin